MQSKVRRKSEMKYNTVKTQGKNGDCHRPTLPKAGQCKTLATPFSKSIIEQHPPSAPTTTTSLFPPETRTEHIDRRTDLVSKRVISLRVV
mmetsp:Transcript_32424/g.64522  ORF Transcript_32424/g.64522 Transcript_32424/m.64522 type:complete len:90 (-) Transcript_32424:275-544(-)